ncbi:MAG TPA: SseB family protein [Pseudonocardiaceae bacterium]|jgi:hypothetical protein|nr:SseB family protein [Pseudonocardiaceae bacterium]
MTDSPRVSGSAEAPSNQHLAQALTEFSAGGDRGAVYRALIPGPVLVPTTRREGQSAAMPSLLAVQIPGGGPALLGFTSVQALREWSRQARSFTVMSGTELAHQARAARAEAVVLDPGGGRELHLAPFELDQLADGLVPVPPGEVQGQLTHATRRVRKTAARWPPAAEAAVRTAARRDGVEHAYLFDLAHNDGEFHPAIGLRFRAGEPPEAIDEILTGLARELQQHLPAEVWVDLVVLDDRLFEAVREIASPLG